MLTAPRIVRTERAVRPCLPMTLPTSCGATLSLRTVFSSLPTACTSTASGSSTRARAISRTSSSTATISFWVIYLPLTVCIQKSYLDRARIVAYPFASVSNSVNGKQGADRGLHLKRNGVRKLGCSGRGMLLDQLGHGGRKLGADATPVADALVLQIDRGWVGAGVVGAHHFNRPAVAGAVLLNNHDAIVGLLAGAKTRQTNHDHGVTVPFKIQCLVRFGGLLRPRRGDRPDRARPVR